MEDKPVIPDADREAMERLLDTGTKILVNSILARKKLLEEGKLQPTRFNLLSRVEAGPGLDAIARILAGQMIKEELENQCAATLGLLGPPRPPHIKRPRRPRAK